MLPTLHRPSYTPHVTNITQTFLLPTCYQHYTDLPTPQMLPTLHRPSYSPHVTNITQTFLHPTCYQNYTDLPTPHILPTLHRPSCSAHVTNITQTFLLPTCYQHYTDLPTPHTVPTFHMCFNGIQFMTYLKKLYINPTNKYKSHWTVLVKEASDNGLLTKAKLRTQ
jgi:hypothetical protein